MVDFAKGSKILCCMISPWSGIPSTGLKRQWPPQKKKKWAKIQKHGKNWATNWESGKDQPRREKTWETWAKFKEVFHVDLADK